MIPIPSTNVLSFLDKATGLHRGELAGVKWQTSTFTDLT